MLDQALLAPLLVGLIFAVIVTIYGYVVPPLYGRPRHAPMILDLVVLALFIAVLVFVLAKLGVMTVHLSWLGGSSPAA